MEITLEKAVFLLNYFSFLVSFSLPLPIPRSKQFFFYSLFIALFIVFDILFKIQKLGFSLEFFFLKEIPFSLHLLLLFNSPLRVANDVSAHIWERRKGQRFDCSYTLRRKLESRRIISCIILLEYCRIYTWDKGNKK